MSSLTFLFRWMCVRDSINIKRDKYSYIWQLPSDIIRWMGSCFWGFLARWLPSRFVLFGWICALILAINFTYDLVSQSWWRMTWNWRVTNVTRLGKPEIGVADSYRNYNIITVNFAIGQQTCFRLTRQQILILFWSYFWKCLCIAYAAVVLMVF